MTVPKKLETVFMELLLHQMAIKVDSVKSCTYILHILLYTDIVYILYNYITL